MRQFQKGDLIIVTRSMHCVSFLASKKPTVRLVDTGELLVVNYFSPFVAYMLVWPLFRPDEILEVSPHCGATVII